MASTITKEQWAEIEQQLKSSYVCLKFTLGCHKITIEKRLVAENKAALIVFIDGQCKGSWFRGDDEVYGPLVQQLWRKRTSSLYKPKEKSRFEKRVGKRRARKIIPNLDAVTVMWTPDFNTAASLVRQYKKIEGLTLVTEETPNETL